MRLSTLRNEVCTYIAAAKEYDAAHPQDQRSGTALGKLRQLLSEMEEEVCDAECGVDEDDDLSL